MNFNRRNFLMALTAFPLFGCQTPGGTAWIADAKILASGLAAIAPQLSNIVGIPTNIASVAQNALQSAATFAADLQGITDPTKAQSTLAQVSQAITAALTVLQPFTALLPPPIGIAITAAQVLIPVILAVINPSAPPPAAASRAMTPDQARLILMGAAKK